MEKLQIQHENVKPFSQSSLWDLERQYFEEMNLDAWSSGDVPHYVTSNPYMARSYADLIISFLRDRAASSRPNEPIYIIELGAGHGKFSYNLLRQLDEKWQSSSIPLPQFKYVITDFVEENIAFWINHPRLQPYFNQNIVDVARFDIENDTQLFLRNSSIILEAGSVKQPFIVIANYLYDCLPTNLLYIDNGLVQNVLVNEAIIDNQNNELSAKQKLENLDFSFTYGDFNIDSIKDPIQQQIIEFYKRTLNNSHIYLPSLGMANLSVFNSISTSGFMLITADKGTHLLQDWQDRSAPSLSNHGCFSISVNYHALKKHCEFSGGLALFPSNKIDYLNIGCLLYVDQIENYKETIHTYKQVIDEFGPDNYFSIKKHVENNIDNLSDRDIRSYIQLSLFDPRLFKQLVPRILDLVESFNQNQSNAYLKICLEVWKNYYPINEEDNLAFLLAQLLTTLEFFDDAQAFLDFAETEGGTEMEIMYLRGVCLLWQNKQEQAKQLLEKVQQYNPDNEQVSKLLKYANQSI